jgi:hypothetical protein
MYLYEVPPRKDKRGVDLISDVLPFGRLWYHTPDNAIGYAMHNSCSHDAVIRVYDAVGNVIETHKHAGGLQRNHERACRLAVFSGKTSLLLRLSAIDRASEPKAKECFGSAYYRDHAK